MNNLLSFESFSQHIKSQSEAKMTEQKTQTQKSMSMAFENLLKEFDVTNPSEISEENNTGNLRKSDILKLFIYFCFYSIVFSKR